MSTSNNTTFIISGGAGRVVCAIPALEKYALNNPTDDFNIIVHGWESLIWSNPILQHRVIGVEQKGTFNNIIKKTRVVYPEPYHLYEFYNQELHLSEAFDKIINLTDDHSDLNYNCLYLSKIEIEASKELIEKYKAKQRMQRSVIFQPYGSGCRVINNKVTDPSNRSLMPQHSIKLIKDMSRLATVINASHPEFRDKQDNISITFDDPYSDYIRILMGLIYHADLFVGVDSLGQHIARAFNKPSVVFMGGTCDENYAYVDHSTIIRKSNWAPVYSPWRLSDVDVEFSDRMNDGIMDFTDEEMKEITHIVLSAINSNYDTIKESSNSSNNNFINYS